MVLLHFKNGEKDQFLYETNLNKDMDSITKEIVEMHNLRVLLKVLGACVNELAQYGPARPEIERGLSEEQLREMAEENKKQYIEPEKSDPNGIRVGLPPRQSEVADTLRKTATDAEAYMSCDQVKMKVCITLEGLKECQRCIQGAVMMAYPMQLPEYDPIRQILDGTADYSGHAISQELFDSNTAVLWWASKQMLREHKLSKYLGRNEKTTIVKGSGPPGREPPVDAETQKNMMAFYYKRQQKQKELEEAEDQTYYNAGWANPRNLKNAITGTTDIRFR